METIGPPNTNPHKSPTGIFSYMSCDPEKLWKLIESKGFIVTSCGITSEGTFTLEGILKNPVIRVSMEDV